MENISQLPLIISQLSSHELEHKVSLLSTPNKHEIEIETLFLHSHPQ